MFWPCALQWISVFFFIANTSANTVHVPRATCSIIPSLNGSDDAPAILSAFKTCGKGGTIVFQNHTYTINSIMNTTGLSNCNIEIHGTLLWSTNITYWLNHSMPLGYQNQSTVWYLGGDNIKVDGFGYGTLDGNGQAWYDFVKGISNYPNRPQALAIYKTTNSVFQGLRFVQSQMWTMTVLKSDGVLLQNIYVNSTSSSGSPARNTDGADTIYSNNIHFDQWTVVNGDDSISLKANSTNILITNSTFYNGLGVAIGSIGQYKGVWETIENVTASHITFYKTLHGGYVKTWTGEQSSNPFMTDRLTMRNRCEKHHIRELLIPFSPWSTILHHPMHNVFRDFRQLLIVCIRTNPSTVSISDINIVNITGSMTNPIASYSCSAVAPCKNITMENLTLKANDGTAATGYKCTNVQGTVGFACS
ncbi:alpha-L-rhamnosidase rgxB protein [Rutstroemia sp. NJR-2017a BBW]|nr:alpha-L-rhamnosidase rgxB protein [Rutstroemia sp. NJR-2017a BBW]